MSRTFIRQFLRRRVFVITILLIQLIFIFFLIAGTIYEFRYAAFALSALSIVVSLHIVNRKVNPAYKIIWIFLILLFPIFGGIIYVMLHNQRSSHKLKRQISMLYDVYRPFFLLPGSSLPFFKSSHKDCAPQAAYLEDYAGFPIYTSTATEYFKSGESFFQRLLPELEKAQKYVFLEFFVLSPGKMLDPIIEILERKAQDGVEVRIIYDDLGCFTSLPSKFKSYLEQKGIKCIVFNPFIPVLSSLQNNRDHRKIVSIDGKVAFTGGMNLADEYINARERFGHWKDSGIMIEGEAAWSLTLIFLHMWNLNSKQKDNPEAFYPWKNEPCEIRAEGFVQPYADTPIDAENVGEHVYIQIINNAKEYVYINTPYLVVDDNLISALTLSAKSGVDVRIITPHRWDKWIVAITSRSYYRLLISAGVKVYEYTEGFNHSKTFVSDDKVATVGTTNLDFRSLYLHFECGVWMYRTASVAKVKEDFLDTLPICREITLGDCARNAVQRIFQDVLRIFAPLM